MFIFITYKDAPELSVRRASETDLSTEKTLLVNPICPVRIMLEYIRKKCRLGIFTQFDLCDDSGILKGLFSMPTYAYATDQFEHKKTYYLIVFKMEYGKKMSVLPQLNRDNARYEDLKTKVTTCMSGDSPNKSPPPAPTPSGKSTPMLKIGAKKK